MCKNDMPYQHLPYVNTFIVRLLQGELQLWRMSGGQKIKKWSFPVVS